ncbi:MAG: glycosyltransferase, partial [Bacteroidaceae bacterium]|nr:glycosyltransferase [Bacteroidaceae bacterium]
DVFVEAMLQANECKKLKRQVLALIQVPAWVYAPREDLKERLSEKKVYDTPLFDPIVTHWLHDSSNDPILKRLHECGFRNEMEDKVKIVFVPCYLDGNDGIFDKPYYDMLIGDDLAVYPSYYEPWGYTPLEAVAFHVPCVTTSLSGFGMWANQVKGAPSKLQDGVEVIERNDYNTHEVIDAMVQTLLSFASSDKKQVDAMRRRAGKLSEKALWKHFISYYYEAYDIALHKMQERNTKNS